MVAPEMVREAVDVSALLRAGVYVLRRSGRVVWIGKTKNIIARLYAHTQQGRGPRTPGMPARPVSYDAIEIRNCLVDDLEVLYGQTCVELRWAP